MDRDDHLSAKSIWRDADSLDFAWFGHSPAALKSQYQASRSEQRSQALRHVMRGEVRLKIAYGDLIAFGIQTFPDLTDYPQEVPATLFEVDATEIDWELGVVTGLGRRFDEVRVILAEQDLKPMAPSVAVKSVQATQIAKRGRKSLGPIFAEAVLALLKNDPDFADRSQEKQVIAIQQKAKELHPGLFHGGAMPGRSTVHNYLKNNKIT